MISYPPPIMPQPAAPPTESAPHARASGRRYQIIFGAIFAGLTVLALALAAIAPDLRPTASQSPPAGWAPVYQHDLTTADSATWDITHGCAFTRQGLDANASESDAAICDFMPAGSGSATTQGFYFELGLAPAQKVPVFQQAMLLVGAPSGQSGDALLFEIDQDGHYTLCDNTCASSPTTGNTSAWHVNAFVANTIAVKVSADHSHEAFYVNGQEVATMSVDMGPQPALAAGAPSGSEVIFTHATLTTGQ
jgi:hypothetical protein